MKFKGLFLLRRAFRRRGYTCDAYDILLNKGHDITAESGWFTLFRMVLQFLGWIGDDFGNLQRQ